MCPRAQSIQFLWIEELTAVYNLTYYREPTFCIISDLLKTFTFFATYFLDISSISIPYLIVYFWKNELLFDKMKLMPLKNIVLFQQVFG